MPVSPCLIVILIVAFAASLALAAAVCSDGSGMMFMIGCRGSTTQMLTATIDCRNRENDDIGALSRLIDTRYPGACGRDNGAIIRIRGNCTTDVLKYAHTCETGVYRGPATIIGPVDKWRLDGVTFRDIEFNLVGPFGIPVQNVTYRSASESFLFFFGPERSCLLTSAVWRGQSGPRCHIELHVYGLGLN